MYVEELCPQHKDQSCCWASVSPICGTKQRGSNYLSPNSTSQLWRSERPTSNSAWCSVSTYLFQTLEEIQGKKKFLLPVYDERQTGSTTDFLSFFFTVISCKAGIQYDLQKKNISCTNKWNRHWSIRKKKILKCSSQTTVNTGSQSAPIMSTWTPPKRQLEAIRVFRWRGWSVE